MAPLKPVKSLYELSSEEALKVVRGYVAEGSKNLAPFRHHLISLLHGRIREELIQRAVLCSKVKVGDLLDIIGLLADSSTRKLQLKRNGEFLHGLLSGQFFSKIDGANVTGLHELHVKVLLEHSNNEVPSSILFHKSLRKGLANSLRVLTLQTAADNQSLKILGQHAHHLTHLDISSSWLVDDIGIGHLLFKDASNLIKELSGGTEVCEPGTIEALASLPLTQANKVCTTLQEVKIQDTNTTSVSLLLLLLVCSNLKSLGGFLYYRNIGDAVISIQSRAGAPPHLSLTELWDTHLPMEKLVKIAKYLPHLTSLYTRAAWLAMGPKVLPNLTCLTADFDFAHYGQVLLPFLSHSGTTLRKLTLIDQVYRLDISHIAHYCPNLEDLTAKVTIENGSNNVLMKHLLVARLRITDPPTFNWVMNNAPNIQRFESLFDFEQEDVCFGDTQIMELIQSKPKSLETIEHLSIHLLNGPEYHMYGVSLTIDTVYALCHACSNLRVLGELHTWNKISKDRVKQLSNYIRKNNWDVRVSFSEVLYHHV